MSYLNPAHIYNFYYINYKFGDHSFPENKKSLILFELNAIKKEYLKNFKEIILIQLEKYLRRGRIDHGAFTKENLTPDTPFDSLHQYMKSTYRSDMRRRNDRTSRGKESWSALTGYLEQLEGAESIESLMFIIDRINNVCHNTEEIILTKFDNANELMRAFEFCHSVRDGEDIKPKTRGIEYLTEKVLLGFGRYKMMTETIRYLVEVKRNSKCQ